MHSNIEINMCRLFASFRLKSLGITFSATPYRKPVSVHSGIGYGEYHLVQGKFFFADGTEPFSLIRNPKTIGTPLDFSLDLNISNFNLIRTNLFPFNKTGGTYGTVPLYLWFRLRTKIQGIEHPDKNRHKAHSKSH